MGTPPTWYVVTKSTGKIYNLFDIFKHLVIGTLVVFRYRKYNLGNDINLICRCEHDAVMQGPSGELQFVNIKALNEWDSRVRRSDL